MPFSTRIETASRPRFVALVCRQLVNAAHARRRPRDDAQSSKFREHANYPASSSHPPWSCIEAHHRYQTAFVEAVGDVGHAEVAWEGKIDRPFIGDAGQGWDKCLLVRYPSRQHFLAMMANAAYRQGLVHRDAGLERTVLLPLRG